MFVPKLVCKDVNLCSWFNTTSAVASRLSSTTIRTPSLSESSLKSVIPSIYLARTQSAICSTKRDLLT